MSPDAIDGGVASRPWLVGGFEAALEAGLVRSGWTAAQFYVAYFAVGGMMTRGELDDVMAGRSQPSSSAYDTIAHALNERFVATGVSDYRMAYADELPNASKL